MTVDVGASIAAGVQHLRDRQDPEGWWKGNLATNVTMDAEDMMLRHFLGIEVAEDVQRSARWIRSQQRSDGTWASFLGGPGELSTTVEAWVALRLAGHDADADYMVKAAEFVRSEGGVERARVFTRIWLSLVGLWSWSDCPTVPPELMFLPKWAPLNIYNWACWARQTVVPLSIVATTQPVHPVGFDIEPLRTHAPAPKMRPVWTVPGLFERGEYLTKLYRKVPFNFIRFIAKRKALKWIIDRQEADGGWGGIQPPWVYSILAMVEMGMPLDHPKVAKAIAGLDGFFVEVPADSMGDEQAEGGRLETAGTSMRWLEACQSPVWDTGLALEALLEAGVAADDEVVLRAAEWLLQEQVTAPGDWQVQRPGLPSAGWAFEFHNDAYPDTDDTAEIVLALSKVRHPEQSRMDAAVDAALEWTIGMQSKDGGWAAFDADNTKTLATQLPFCDFGNVINPPSADVTAHVVEMMAEAGMAGAAECQRGVLWLLANQEPGGSWFGRWGANHLYGTGAVVPALVAAGVPRDHGAIQRAVAWVLSKQNADGGWGEDMRSYHDDEWIGRGSSTASQTAWALLTLLAAGVHGDAVDRGIAFLTSTQLPNGCWDEELYTGTGFPGFFYINYELYRVVFPMWALARYARATGQLADGMVEERTTGSRLETTEVQS